MVYVAYQMLAMVQIFLVVAFRIEEHCLPGPFLKGLGAGRSNYLDPHLRFFIRCAWRLCGMVSNMTAGEYIRTCKA